jgi:hypothetical protein
MKDLNDVIAAAVLKAVTQAQENGVDEAQAGPAVFEPADIAEKLKIWWESGAGDKYIIEDGINGSATYHEWSGSMLVKWMRQHYVAMKPRKGEPLAQTDQVLLHVMRNRRLDLVLDSLPGYCSGIFDYAGKQMLVRTSPRLLKPAKGDWSTVKALIDGCMDLSVDGGIDQTAYFYSWLKIAVESLYRAGPGNHQAGQCCIFAGPKNCGKSRIQHWIITGLLGGRSADPGPYLFGDTDFNGEWLEGEHLLIEDPATSTATKDRVFFGERIKQTVISDKIRIHIKRMTALNLELFIRMSISVNDDPDKIRVLPLLTPDMKDKVHLFLVRQAEMPMPTLTLEDRIAFKQKITAELPTFLWWLLNEFEIPKSIREDRMGVVSWRHPTIEREMFEDTPGAELLRLIDMAQWEGSYLWQLESASSKSLIWEGTSLDLELLLTGKTDRDGNGRMVYRCTVGKEAERLLAHNKLDRLLSRLKEDEPDRVIQHRTSTARNWMIHAPISDA